MMNKARSMFRETVCFLLETEWGWIENVDDEVRENVVYVLMPINAVGARRLSPFSFHFVWRKEMYFLK